MDLLRLHSLNIQTVQLNQCPFTVGNLQNSKGFANKRPQLLSQPRKRSNLRVLPVLDNSRRCNLQSLQALCTSNGNILETGAHESVMADEHTSLLEKKGNEVVKDLKGSCIYLLGMMGSGKSTVGRILAEALGYYFFDSDKLVEEAAGVKSVAQIIKEDEESFRNAETEVLKQLSCMGRLVVATGGGIVARPINWSYLRHGVTIWLDVPLEALAKRVVAVGVESRPLLGATGSDSPYNQALESLTEIFKVRGPAYSTADATVSLQKVATSMDFEDLSFVTPTIIAIQVLEEINKLILQKKQLNPAAGA